MKFIATIIIAFLTYSSIGQNGRDGKVSYDFKEFSHNFSDWTTDSIKSFLADSWIHIGKFENNKIIPDTVSVFMTNSDTVKRTVIIDPSGKYHSSYGKKVKQGGIPSIRIEFSNGMSVLNEDDCFLPDFSRCNFSFHCFSIKFLEVKRSKFFIRTMDIRKKIQILYLDQNLIVIENTAYIRLNKWKEYAANNVYN